MQIIGAKYMQAIKCNLCMCRARACQHFSFFGREAELVTIKV